MTAFTSGQLKRPILLSIGVAVATLLLKVVASWLTGSVGLLSDAAESIVNLFAALTAYVSLHYSARPVDATHTYGHEKIEFFSSGLEGVLILAAAFGIAWYAVQRLLHQSAVQALEWGAAMTLAASLLNLAVARHLLRVGRAAGSIVLEADGQHLMTDVWTSLAVLAGLGLVWWTDLQWLDPVVGLLAALNIVWTGFGLLRRSFNGLMDHALPEPEQVAVRQAIEAHLEPQMDYHALRTRQAGPRRFVDFHLLVPGRTTVKAAHDAGERMEAAIRTALPQSEVTVHLEPIEERAAWEDSALVALEQARRH